jgi:hypothetical protein
MGLMPGSKEKNIEREVGEAFESKQDRSGRAFP